MENAETKFIKEVEELAKKMAHFYAVDFHVHSPDSHDFPKVDGRDGYSKTIPANDTISDPQAKREAFKDSLRNVSEKIDIVAITDHNKSQFATELTKDVKSPVVFPGMEVTVKTTPEFTQHKVHLLCLFPQGTPETEIERIFPTTHSLPPVDQRNENTSYTGDVHQLIENVHNLKGIVIAAHVNNKSGVRKTFLDYDTERLGIVREIRKLKDQDTSTPDEEARLKQLEKRHAEVDDDLQKRYLSFLDNHSIDAVQTSYSGEEVFYGQHHVALLGLNPFPCLLCSDAHNSADIGVTGGKTYIKLHSLTLEGVKSAFKDPGARLRYDSKSTLTDTAYIEGLEVAGGFLDGVKVAFSKNLSCLIGGRGSGKSALIEVLRFVFDSTIPDDMKGDVARMHEFILKGASIKVLFRTADGERLILECSRSKDGTPIFECRDSSGNLCPEITQKSERLNLDLYGWSEVEKLSYDISGQRALIDSAIPEKEELVKSVKDKLGELDVNRNEIIDSIRKYNDLLPNVSKLKEAKATKSRILSDLRPKLKKLQEKKLSQSEKKIDSLNTQIDTLSESIDEYKQAIQDFEETEIITPKTALLKLFPKKTQDRIKNLSSAGKKALADARKNIEGVIQTLEKKQVSLEADVLKEQEVFNQLQNDPQYQNCLELLRHKKAIEAEIRKYQQDDARMKRAKSKLEADLEKHEELCAKLAEKQNLLREQRTEVVKKINVDLAEINKKLEDHNVKLEVDIKESGDRTQVTNYLKEQMKNVGNQYIVQNHPQSIAEAFSPRELYEVLWGQDESKLAKDTVLNKEQAKKVLEHFRVQGPDGTYSVENAERVLKICELVHGDKPVIAYNGKSLNDGLSPGQRCTALLPLVFLRTTLTPLIIDQPEDNLDSQLVFELVVDMLRGLKERRQVIIATHNPNIPVSGDAEQVIALVADSDKKTKVVRQGSIDDKDITEKIKALLEGGEEAFKIRSRKYGLLK